jgi:glycosyltransferase involved in cell wall biosynthesis
MSLLLVVLPPRERGPTCPFVQRTTNLIRVLERLGVTVRKREHGEMFEGRVVFHAFPLPEPPWPSAELRVECGVGYDTPPREDVLRVYESEAWRHFLWGKYGSTLADRRRSWVIPWAFDEAEWPLGPGGDYVSYLGRLMPDKGFRDIYTIARSLPKVRFKIGGRGGRPLTGDPPPNVEYVGPVDGTARAAFLGGALAHLCPTEYVEPLNGSAIEAMLCGTPVISTSWGGFTETVADGVTGFRCADAAEMVRALGSVRGLGRADVRRVTSAKFGLDAAAVRWRRALLGMGLAI